MSSTASGVATAMEIIAALGKEFYGTVQDLNPNVDAGRLIL